MILFELVIVLEDFSCILTILKHIDVPVDEFELVLLLSDLLFRLMKLRF